MCNPNGHRGLVREPICILTEAKAFGGVEIHTLGLIAALIETGYRVNLISCRHKYYDDLICNNGWGDRVHIIHTELSVGRGFGEEGSSNIKGWIDLFRCISKGVLIFPKGNNAMGSLRFLRVCRSHFRKIVFIEHLEDPRAPKKSRRLFGFIPIGIGLWWYREGLLKYLQPQYADLLIAVSDKIKQRLVEDWGNKPRKITVVRNGVSWRKFARNYEHQAAFRSAYHLPGNAFVFGMLARLRHEKGIDIALEAFRRLLQMVDGTPIYLVIAGRGPDEEELLHLRTELGLERYVIFTGFVSDVREVISGFDVILFSSRLEGLPIGLLEGMAAGCVPIVTRVSGMPEVVTSPDIGFVVTPEDPEDLAGAMREVLLLDEDSLAMLRANAVHRIRDAFDLDTCTKKILEVCGL